MVKKVVSIILVLLWMVLIFSFSKENGKASGGLSDGIIISFVERFTEIEDETPEMDEIVDMISFPLRKFAHFFIYFVLAFLVMNCLWIWGVNKYTLIIASIICILYAISDEVHQSFVNGRTGQISDVLLDSSASLLSAYLYHKYVILRGKYEKVRN